MTLESFTLDEKIQLCIHMLATVDSALIARGKAQLNNLESNAVSTYLENSSTPSDHIRYILKKIEKPPFAPKRKPIESLLAALDDESEHVRYDAISEHGWPGNYSAVQPLLRFWSTSSTQAKANIARTLGWIGDSSILDTLLEGLASPYSFLREAVVEALVMFKEPSTVEVLIDLLHDPENGVLERVATALGRIGDPSAILPLLELLERCDRYPDYFERDEPVKMQVIIALGRFSEDYITELLMSILKNRRGYDERAALIALCRQGTEQSLNAASEVMINRAEMLGYIELLLSKTSTPETIRSVLELLPHSWWNYWMDKGIYRANDWKIWEDLSSRVLLRRTAAEYLGRRASPFTIDAFKAVLGDEDDGLVGQAAAALLRIGTIESYRGVLDWIKVCPNSIAIISEAQNMDLWDLEL